MSFIVQCRLICYCFFPFFSFMAHFSTDATYTLWRLIAGKIRNSCQVPRLQKAQTFKTALTGLARVHDEAGVAEGACLGQAVAMGLDQAGVPDLGLDHHDADGAVGDVGVVLQDADQVLAHLVGDEGDS